MVEHSASTGDVVSSTSESDTVCIVVTLRSIIVTTMWVVGVAVALADIVYPPNLAALSVAFTVGGATLSVRGRIDKYAADWTTAYGAGREVAQVRQIR